MSRRPGRRPPGQGFWGRALHVDLGSGRAEVEEFEEDYYRQYLGGVGLGAEVLWRRLKPGVDPLGPENVLGFTTGLLTDTGALFSGRFTVVAKSPASGGWGDSNCGGYFSPALKRCGLDTVFFHGAAERPVYLVLDESGAAVRDAAELWGADTVDTETRLKERHGRVVQVACIGPAGERLSRLAGIATDRGRLAARGGLGGVMGAKGLKAVVAAGRTRVGVADPEGMTRLSREFRRRLEGGQWPRRLLGERLLGWLGRFSRVGPVRPRQPADLWRLLLGKYGTSAVTAMSAESGDSPVRNWTGAGFRDFPLSLSRRLGPEAVAAYQVKRYGCHACPLRCGGIVRLEGLDPPIQEMHRPEYETLCAFGALVLNNDLEAIFRINDLVNRGGIDSISCGAAVAFAVECFENGLLTRADADGLELTWGNAEALVKLTEKIILRQGLGDLLAEGVKVAAEKIGRGAEEFAVHCGGVEAPMHDPKFDPGFAVSYACEPTPGRHTITSLQYLELQRLERKFSRARHRPLFSRKNPGPPEPGQAEALAVGSFYKMLIDCAGLCLFGTQVGADLPLCRWLNAATGWSYTPDQYLVTGERVEQLRHAFNVREGLNPIRDFKPHPRTYGQPPQAAGPARNLTLDQEGLMRSFYRVMGWDPETGRPERERLLTLGLEQVAATLHEGEV